MTNPILNGGSLASDCRNGPVMVAAKSRVIGCDHLCIYMTLID
jgi:hypothetical protein